MEAVNRTVRQWETVSEAVRLWGIGVFIVPITVREMFKYGNFLANIGIMLVLFKNIYIQNRVCK